MYSSAKYQLCIFSLWKMTGKLQFCYLMYDLCSKLQLLSIWSILFRQKPPYGRNLPPSHRMSTSETHRTSLTELSTFVRLRSREAQAHNNPGMADQNQSAVQKQYQGGCLAHGCNIFIFDKVQPVVQCCKLASYYEEKVTKLRKATHRNMWTA